MNPCIHNIATPPPVDLEVQAKDYLDSTIPAGMLPLPNDLNELNRKLLSDPDLLVRVAHYQLHAMILAICMRLCFVMGITDQEYIGRYEAHTATMTPSTDKANRISGDAGEKELENLRDEEQNVYTSYPPDVSSDLYTIYVGTKGLKPNIIDANIAWKFSIPYIVFFRALCLRQGVRLVSVASGSADPKY